MARPSVKMELVEKCLVKFNGEREFIDNCETALRLVGNEEKEIV